MSTKKWQISTFSQFINEEEEQTFVPDSSANVQPDAGTTPTVDPQTTPQEQPQTQPNGEEQTDQPVEVGDSNAQEIITQLKSLVEVTSDKLSIGVPSDVNGHGTAYGNIEKAIQKIEDHVHYYSKKNEGVKFYCWNLGWNDYQSGSAVEKKFKRAGVNYEKYKFIDLGQLVKYFQANPDDAGLLKSVSISLESKSSDEHAESMSSGEQGSLD